MPTQCRLTARTVPRINTKTTPEQNVVLSGDDRPSAVTKLYQHWRRCPNVKTAQGQTSIIGFSVYAH